MYLQQQQNPKQTKSKVEDQTAFSILQQQSH